MMAQRNVKSDFVIKCHSCKKNFFGNGVSYYPRWGRGFTIAVICVKKCPIVVAAADFWAVAIAKKFLFPCAVGGGGKKFKIFLVKLNFFVMMAAEVLYEYSKFS
jgi:hypothetical protein